MLKNCKLKAGGKVFDKFFRELGLFSFEEVACLGLEARETKVKVFTTGHRFGEGVDGLAGFGHFGQDGTTGVTKLKHAGNLVVSLTGSVVKSFTQELVLADPVHKD